MNDYKPNSNRFKEEQKNAPSDERRVSKIVKGNVKTKKKSEISKLADIFIVEDIHTVISYAFTDVLVPGAKKIIRDVLFESIDMLFGTTGRSGRKSDGPNVSYAKFYDKDRREERRSYDAPSARSKFDYDSLIFESRGEANMVLDEMNNVIDTYKFVSVADLYEMAGVNNAPYTSNKFGWSNINTAEVVRVSDGYVIKLPKALPLD